MSSYLRKTGMEARDFSRVRLHRGYKVIIPKGTNSTFDNDYMDRETTYKYYNDMMWPERFASCISVDDAIKMIEDL